MSSSGPSPLDQIIQQALAAASQAGGEHAEKMRALIEGVMKTPAAGQGVQALGEGLSRVLDGKHSEEAVAGLPPNVTTLVNTFLQALGKPTSGSGS